MNRRDILLAGALAGTLPAHLVFGQERKRQCAAVVIGVDKAGTLPKLKAAASGARQVERLLAAEGYDVQALVDDNGPVTVDRVFQAVDGFIDKGIYDQLVIFFAGHGFAAEYVEYWLLSDAIRNPNQAISLRESAQLARLYSGIPNVIFISDACRSTPGSLGLTAIKGGVIFPTTGSRKPSAVDQFMATLVGDPSFEVSVAESSSNYEGIYTSALLSAFAAANPDVTQKIDGVDVVPNRRLKRYLEREVPLRAQRVNIQLNQRPDALVTSDDDTYIARVTGHSSSQASGAVANLRQLANTRLDQVGIRGMGGGSPPAPISSAMHELDVRTGFSTAQNRIAHEIETFDTFVERHQNLPGSTGFFISGQAVAAAFALSAGKVQPFQQINENTIVFNARHGEAVTALIFFSDGSSTMAAAPANYMGNIVVAQNGIINITYLPRARMYDREKLSKLHATVATAARFGVFRIDREEGRGANSGASLANSIRMMKSIDPTLGLYAAYAYAEVGRDKDVESVRHYMRGDLGFDIFDTAMLSGALAKAGAGLKNTAPLCPMLAQGWALLRVNHVVLPKAINTGRQHLKPSLWTTFDATGTRILRDAMDKGLLFT